MRNQETGRRFARSSLIGIVEDQTGKNPVVRIVLSDQPMAEALIGEIERRTGGRLEPFDLDGSKSFGFSNWKGSTWVPEGPRQNWMGPKKSN